MSYPYSLKSQLIVCQHQGCKNATDDPLRYGWENYAGRLWRCPAHSSEMTGFSYDPASGLSLLEQIRAYQDGRAA